ncbi:hypothetical protein PybrP1_009032 [[Pythium] brassicae (nom. inval.)]|nr:hypothetical protein PybrP1_009032 [[Pythium] brassicae (nom. inval.)]
MATTTDSSSSATPAPALRRFELRGFERVAALEDSASFKVAHVMLVRSQLDELVRHLPQALVLTFNKHPRMRARQVRGAFALAEVQPPIALDALVKSRLLGIRGTNAEEERLGKWQKHIEEESNLPFDRFSQFPFFLRVWVNKPAGTARLILFSDKVVSDAMSGTVVLHDLLAFASSLSLGRASLEKEKAELPLRPSLYNMWLDNLFSAGLTKFWVKWCAASGFKSGLKTFTPLLEPRRDQNPMAMPPKCNATSVLFADGAPENLKKIQAACDREGVKIQSALAVAVLLGYYSTQPQAMKLALAAAQPDGELEPEVTPTASKKVADAAASKKSKSEPVKPFKLRMDAHIDMRRRVEYPVQEVQIGDYTTSYAVETFAREGVAMDAVKFWDLARANKHELDALLVSYSLPAPLIFADQNLNSRTPAKFFEDVPLPRSATADVTLANLGSYIHASSHDFRAVDPKTKKPTTAKLTVESLHVSYTSPHLTSAAALFVTSVKALSFGIAHKYEDKTGRQLFANLVALIESVGDVGTNELLSDVVARVLQQNKLVGSAAATTA